jgi:hypothetical protein|eukprot:COSAG01_NODE_4283_length_5175_cov_23.836879_7_plen_215_part_00
MRHWCGGKHGEALITVWVQCLIVALLPLGFLWRALAREQAARAELQLSNDVLTGQLARVSARVESLEAVAKKDRVGGCPPCAGGRGRSPPLSASSSSSSSSLPPPPPRDGPARASSRSSRRGVSVWRGPQHGGDTLFAPRGWHGPRRPSDTAPIRFTVEGGLRCSLPFVFEGEVRAEGINRQHACPPSPPNASLPVGCAARVGGCWSRRRCTGG